MRIAVAYSSEDQATRLLAEELARTLRTAGAVELLPMETEALRPGTDLLIVGAPTAVPSSVGAFLDGLPDLSGVEVASFNARPERAAALNGSAAEAVALRLQSAGGRLATAPESFALSGVSVLRPDEQAHVRRWALGLVAASQLDPDRRGVVAPRDRWGAGHRNEGADRRLAPLLGAGAWAAIATIALILLNGLVLIFYPIPTTVIGHFRQIQANALVGLVNLDLVMLISQLLVVAVYVALYAVLRRVRPLAALIGLGLSLGGVLLYASTNPSLSFLYLSDQYASAGSAAERAALIQAGATLWANYQGSAFAIAYVMAGLATLVFAGIMLRSGIFNRATAYIGIAVGLLGLVPPLPVFGTVGVVVSSVSLAPMVVFLALVAWTLLRIEGGERSVRDR